MRKKQEWNGKKNRGKNELISTASPRDTYADSLYMSSQKSAQTEDLFV